MEKFAEEIKTAAVVDPAEIKRLSYENGSQYIDQMADMIFSLSKHETKVCEEQGYTFYGADTDKEKAIEMIRSAYEEDAVYGLFVKEELKGMIIHSSKWPTFYGLSVDESVRRKGYGKRLVQTVMDNHTVSHVHVVPGNLDSIRLYESMGFELVPIMQMNNKN